MVRAKFSIRAGQQTPPSFSGGGWEGVVRTRIIFELCPYPDLEETNFSNPATVSSFRFIFTLLLFTFCLITHSSLAAQTAYTGGPGDGHAMGELVLRQVSIGELGAENGYAIYPSFAKPNEAIYITAPSAGEFTLVDLTGRTVIRQTLQLPVRQLPITVTGAGSYIAILRTAEGTFTQKIVVVE